MRPGRTGSAGLSGPGRILGSVPSVTEQTGQFINILVFYHAILTLTLTITLTLTLT